MACRDCKNCTNSAFAHAGRKTGRTLAFFATAGLSEAAMATQKKCRGCGHQMSLHGVDQVDGAPQPTVQIQGAVQVQAAPGWYYPHGPAAPAMWWDGTRWI